MLAKRTSPQLPFSTKIAQHQTRLRIQGACMQVARGGSGAPAPAMKVTALATRHTSASPCSLKAAYCSISAGGTALYTHHSRLTIRLQAAGRSS
jgi:hypothetical protein